MLYKLYFRRMLTWTRLTEQTSRLKLITSPLLPLRGFISFPHSPLSNYETKCIRSEGYSPPLIPWKLPQGIFLNNYNIYYQNFFGMIRNVNLLIMLYKLHFRRVLTRTRLTERTLRLKLINSPLLPFRGFISFPHSPLSNYDTKCIWSEGYSPPQILVFLSNTCFSNVYVGMPQTNSSSSPGILSG